MKKSVYRIILMVSGLLHILPFLLIPYAKLEGLMGGLGELAGAIGMGEAYPESLTALTAIQQAELMAEENAGLVTFVFAMPLIIGMGVLLINFLGKKKLSYILTMLLSIVGAGAYALIVLLLSDYEMMGYSINATAYIFIILSVIQIIVSLAGCVKEKSAAAPKTVKEKRSRDKNVKVGKKDGKITGVRGAYAGAEIPLKGGKDVIIGRDPAVCNIVVKDEKASRKHCVVAYNASNGMYAVTDYSANGVYDRDGNRIPEKIAVPMPAGSEFRIGKEGDIFRLG